MYAQVDDLVYLSGYGRGKQRRQLHRTLMSPQSTKRWSPVLCLECVSLANDSIVIIGRAQGGKPSATELGKEPCTSSPRSCGGPHVQAIHLSQFSFADPGNITMHQFRSWFLFSWHRSTVLSIFGTLSDDAYRPGNHHSPPGVVYTAAFAIERWSDVKDVNQPQRTSIFG